MNVARVAHCGIALIFIIKCQYSLKAARKKYMELPTGSCIQSEQKEVTTAVSQSVSPELPINLCTLAAATGLAVGPVVDAASG